VVPAASASRWDADLIVPPEGVNGVRLVYRMEHHAMRPLNPIGNKFFELAFPGSLDSR
jgi:hypothetical protein